MEDMLWRFPHVGEQIFTKLSNKDLAKSRKIGKSKFYFKITPLDDNYLKFTEFKGF